MQEVSVAAPPLNRTDTRPPPLKDGVLQKLSVRRPAVLIKNWRTRRIVVRQGIIEWVKPKETGDGWSKPPRCVHLSSESTVAAGGPKPHCLTVTASARKLVLRAASDDERDEWLSVIQQALRAPRRGRCTEGRGRTEPAKTRQEM